MAYIYNKTIICSLSNMSSDLLIYVDYIYIYSCGYVVYDDIPDNIYTYT